MRLFNIPFVCTLKSTVCLVTVYTSCLILPRLDVAQGFHLMEAQYKAHSNLTIKQPSTLGPQVGRGLFAREDIPFDDDNDGFLCYFFGMILLATPEQVSCIPISLNDIMTLYAFSVEVIHIILISYGFVYKFDLFL